MEVPRSWRSGRDITLEKFCEAVHAAVVIMTSIRPVAGRR
jgi:hypothetical protein